MTARDRHYTIIDRFCINADQALRAIFDNPTVTGRNYPGMVQTDAQLSEAQRKKSAALMRVNHAGEVCAQALYHGQGMVSRNPAIKQTMKQAALEEGDHLAWCGKRLCELGSHTSYLNPLWYLGSFTMGLSAGLIGDKWSLGFLAETEKQVVEHLENHLVCLAGEDQRSSSIVLQMQQDEAEHRDSAIHAGAAELPPVIKKVMKLASKVMVKIAYWI